jgi:hypothetical protein
MLWNLASRGTKLIVLVVLVAAGLLFGSAVGAEEGPWDPEKYISIDEVRAGMEAYCLTVYEGSKIEKFGLEVIDVIRGQQPGRNAILVQGTDDRFIHTGPVAGCSGSPVYIDGRLAGALAFGWFFSKDPLYGVTPIKEMLRVGWDSDPTPAVNTGGFSFDFSRPVDLNQIAEQISHPQFFTSGGVGGATILPSPLVVSGLTSETIEQIDSLMSPYGFMAVAGVGSAGSASGENISLSPGSCLAVPLVSGDIKLEIIGTVTEVRGKDVYAFGHNFLGYGPTELPMATGKIHTVVSTLMRSFKLGSGADIVGSLTSDESTAVKGEIGLEAATIPMTIRIERYNDSQTRVYNCRVAKNRILTPTLFRIGVAGAALMRGTLPPDHAVEYEVNIGIENSEPIMFKNVSTGLSVGEVVTEISAVTGLLMNNPYEEASVESLEATIRMFPESISSRLWSVDMTDSVVKAGRKVEVGVTVETFRAEKKKYKLALEVPENLAPGNYELLVCGGGGYLQFLRKAAPFRFIPGSMPGLIEALDNILQVRRDRLYCVLLLPAGGVTLEGADLPDLPATKALVLQDPKRTLRAMPYRHWIEDSVTAGTVVLDKKIMRLTVEK